MKAATDSLLLRADTADRHLELGDKKEVGNPLLLADSRPHLMADIPRHLLVLDKLEVEKDSQSQEHSANPVDGTNNCWQLEDLQVSPRRLLAEVAEQEELLEIEPQLEDLNRSRLRLRQAGR